MKGSFKFSFLICAILTVTTSSQSWPCQRDKLVRTLLSDALRLSRTLAGQISALRNNMTRRWPLSPFNATNIGFFGPRRSSNKSTVKPQQILKANIRTLRTFISLIDNSTSQLRSLQVEELVTNKLVDLKRETKALNSYLRNIVRIITFNRRGKTSTVPQGGQLTNNNNNKPASRPVQTKPLNTTSMGSAPTIQNVARRTQLIMVDFRSNVLALASDLQKIGAQTCN